MINVGIIGCGRIADLHQRAYVGNPAARVCAVCDVDAECAKARRRDWKADSAYTDYRDLLDDPGVDAVEILTPHALHEPMAVDAAAAGKHIALQKPMSTSLDSAQRILEAVSAAGVVFKVTDNYPFYPPLARAKALIDEGAIGEPLSLRMKFLGGRWQGGWEVPEETWGWRVEEARQGRGLQTFDHGHHLWTTAWFFLGAFERVVSWIDRSEDIAGCPMPIDCPAVIMWKHRAAKRYGICDYVHAGDLPIPSKYYACDEWFELTGSAGLILVRRCTGEVDPGPALRLFNAAGWQDFDVESDWAAGFVEANRNFLAAIEGREAPLLDGADALHVLRFAFALRRSSDLRREVAVDEPKEVLEK